MSAERRRALVVFPCTLNGYAGNIARVGQIVRALSPHYDVHFLSLVQGSGVADDLARHDIPVARVGLDAALLVERALRLLYKSVYVANRVLVEFLRVRRYYSFSPFDWCARLLLRAAGVGRPYDAAVFNYAWTARGLRSVCRRFAIDTHDLHADRHQRLGFRSWVSLSAEDEERRLSEAAAAIAISEAEHDALCCSKAGVRSVFVPYFPASSASGHLGGEGRNGSACVFVGSGNALNVHALENAEAGGLLAMCRDLGLRFLVVGAVCDSDIAKQMKLRWGETVELLGSVRDLRAVFDSCSVGVNTCGPSTGLKIKTVEYLASGLHVIASRSASDPWLERSFPNSIKIVDIEGGRALEGDVTEFLRRAINGATPIEQAAAAREVSESVNRVIAALDGREAVRNNATAP